MSSSRLLVQSSSQYLHHSSAAEITAYPCTVSAWVKMADFSADASCWSVNRTTGTNWQNVVTVYVDTTQKTSIWIHDGTNSQTTASSTTCSAGTWAHVAYVFASSTSRSAYMNGGGKVTGTTDVSWPTSLATTLVGAYGYVGSTLSDYFDGNLFEICVWNKALTDANITSLAGGTDPTTIEAANIVALYFTGSESDADQDDSYDLTAVNSPTWDSDDIPAARTGGGASVVPIVLMHQRRLRG